MIAGQGEVATDKKEIPAAIARDDATIPRGRIKRGGVDRRQRHIACKAERALTRQQEAVPRLSAHRVGNALYCAAS